MPTIEYILLFAAVLLSGLSFFLLKKIKPQTLKLALSFTGSFLFAISVMHLIPAVYKNGGNNIGAFILAGFFIQLLIEYFSEGIEHGHIHVHEHHHRTFPLTMMVGLCLHSFLEAMPLGDSSHLHTHNESLFYGILLHHIPVAVALMSMLNSSHIKTSVAVACLVIFAGMPPLGAFVSSMLNEHMLTDLSVFYNYIMAIVIGIFLHISTTILFESNEEHRFNTMKLIVIIAGAALAFV